MAISKPILPDEWLPINELDQLLRMWDRQWLRSSFLSAAVCCLDHLQATIFSGSAILPSPDKPLANSHFQQELYYQIELN
jgi:hypothetical protein